MAETQSKVRLREYETLFLVRAESTDEQVDALRERVRGIINRDGGKALRFSTTGKKKTAYLIEKAARATYVHASYLGDSKLVAEIERNLRNIDDVVRFLSIKVADEVDPETRPVLEDVKVSGEEDVRPAAADEGRQAAQADDADDASEG